MSTQGPFEYLDLYNYYDRAPGGTQPGGTQPYLDPARNQLAHRQAVPGLQAEMLRQRLMQMLAGAGANPQQFGGMAGGLAGNEFMNWLRSLLLTGRLGGR